MAQTARSLLVNSEVPQTDRSVELRSRESLIREIDSNETVLPGVFAGDQPVENGRSADEWKSLLSDVDEPQPANQPAGPDWCGEEIGADGRYRIERRIGGGGMGSVYLAEDRNRNGTRVAIKVPRESLLEMPGFLERFEREFKALITLEHPHICRVIDTGRHRNIPFVVMQNLSGGHLGERYLCRGRAVCSIENLLSWLRPVAAALDFMHERGYLHRDVKPENILFDEHGHAWLGDFGIVRALRGTDGGDSDRSLTRRGECVGTPGYIAPEILRGRFDHTDGRSDLYSLAAVTYQFLTGCPPFDGETGDLIRVAQLTQSPRPAHEVNPVIPASASEVLTRSLSREPEERPAYCAEFVAQLSAASGLPGSGSMTPLSGGHSAQVGNSTRLENPVIASGGSSPAPLEAAHPTRRRSSAQTTLLLSALAMTALGFAVWDLRDPAIPSDPFSAASGAESDVDNASRPAHEESAERHFQNARIYLADDEPENALQEINAIPASAMRAEFFALRGQALFALDEPDLAFEQMTAAIEREPQASFHADRARMYLAAGQSDDALRDLNQAVELAPAEARYLAERGLLHLSRKNYQPAIDDYSSALERRDQSVTGAELAAWYNGRGHAYAALQQLEPAREDASRAIEAQPDEPRHYQNRARVLSRLGRADEARSDEEAAARLAALD